MNLDLSVALLIILISFSSSEITHRYIFEKFMDGPTKELFKVYHFLFNKNYELNSFEGIRRYKIFKEKVAFIKETNSKHLSYKLGINQFSDLTEEEYRSRLIFKDMLKNILKN
jgi:hypothetical protein